MAAHYCVCNCVMTSVNILVSQHHTADRQ